MQAKKISYLVGTSSFTKQMNINEKENVDFINKQLSLSIPLITGVKIEEKKETKQIFVGKEISLDHINENNYWVQKYDIPLEKLTDLLLLGFKRACVLNFKKYDSVIVGVHDEDIVVPDYYALKKMIIIEKKENF